MKQFLLLIALFTLSYVNGQIGVNPARWELVWQDNFSHFDTTAWSCRDNFDHYGGRALYLKDNVYTQDGNLVIEVKAQEYNCPEWLVEPNWFCVREYQTGEPYKYTSGYVESKERLNVKFGFLEARIKFPYQATFWPAFWTFLGEGVKDFTNYAEIDIAEMLGPRGSKIATTNIHREYCSADRPTYNQGCPEIKDYIEEHTIKGYDWENWHVYGVEWNEKRMRFYIDGKRVRTIRNHGIVDPVRILFNVGIWPTGEVDEALLPQKMLVDYVRVYKSR